MAQTPSAHFSRPLLAFTGLYLLAAIIAAAIQRNVEFVFYLVVMGVLVSAILAVHKTVRLSQGVLWGLSIWGLLHMAGGLIPIPESWTEGDVQKVLYSWWIIPGRLKFDQVVHAFGFGITTWMCFQILSSNFHRQSGQWPKATFGLCLLSAACGMGFGALNEVIEFIAVLTIPNTNVGGYVNTGWDLVSNLTGCTLVGFWLYFGGGANQSGRSE